MKIKQSLIMLILISLFISIAGVSAADLNDNNTVSIDQPSDDGLSISIDDIKLQDNNKTFDDLVVEIENANPGDIIHIDKDYYCENITSGIIIGTDNITIDGAGSVFYGSEKANTFDFITVSASNVVLKDIIFDSISCNESYNVIEWIGENGTITSCSFYNCSSVDEGIIEWMGSYGLIEGCEFSDNIVNKDAGAVFARSDYLTISNSRFANNSAYRGGAIFANGKNYNIKSCEFVDNAADEGGAVYGFGVEGVVDNCNFNNNHADSYGGAINWISNYGNITNSIFENNDAIEGGAIRVSCLETYIINDRFINNTAMLGGAIYTAENKNIVINTSKFYNNNATIGGAICCEDQGIIYNSEFEGNMADNAGAIFADGECNVTDSTFKNNQAANYAGAIAFLKEGNIADSTFQENSAETGGAVIFLENGQITNSLFEKNTAQLGGAIIASGNLTVNDTIFKANKGELYLTNNILSESGKITLNNVTSDTDASLILAEIEFVGVVNNIYGNNVSIIFNVTVDDKLFENPDGIVLLNINGENYSANASNGTVVFTVHDLDEGLQNYNVMYSSPGFAAYEMDGNFTVLSTVYGDDLVKFFKNGTQYYATFLDSQNNPLADGTNVTFNINGAFYTRKVNGSEGKAKININLEPGKYVITAINPVNGEMHSNNITVLATLESRDLVKYYRNASQFYITLIDGEGNPVSDVNITLNINGVFYDRITKENGTAKLNINLEPGKYILTAIDPLTGLMMSYNITVLPIMNASDMEMKYMDGSTFNVTVLDGQGNPLANASVTFNINGVFYIRQTDSSGIAKLNIRLMSGEYIITSEYNRMAISNTITIKD